MSLQLLAKQMEAKGRGGDSVLVHMTPSEVAGLQKLAESAGGSLSVNPETGLVEANFLKRMLPTLVGIGVGAATMNPYLGAAAGAAVGGYQAKQNDQDVLLGAAMGGLGGYGGAGIGAGLGAAGATGTAAQAISNPALAGQVATGAGSQASMLAAQNAGFGAQGTASLAQAAGAATPSTMAQMGQGISALGKEAGRDAFMSQVGGGAGLLSDVSMAAAPLMAPGKKPGDAPVDDEMYSYTFDPGRTNVERTPTDSTSERRYFDSSFSPLRRIRASEYGFAEGGEAAAPAMNASDAAYAYLMGDSPSSTGEPTASQAGLSYLMGERSSSAPVRGPAFMDAQMMQSPAASRAPVVGSDNMYAFDPATGTFLRNPNVAGATSDAVRGPVGTSFAGGDGYQPVAPNPDFDTPEKQAAYYAANPTMGAITRAGQTALRFLPGASAVFAAQDYMNPGFRQAQENLTYGVFAPPSSGAGYFADNSLEMGGDSGGNGGGYASDYGSQSYGGEQYGDSPMGTYAAGGLMGLAKGGMASGGFVVPADVVSALGNGSTDAGLRKLSAMMGDVKPIKGKGDGLSDSIPTNIDGKQPARVADGEAYIDPQTVKRIGGAKRLYAMMDKIRAQAHGKTSQQRKVNPAKVMA